MLFSIFLLFLRVNLGCIVYLIVINKDKYIVLLILGLK